MKILYIYQFLTHGGVEMLLKNRCSLLKKYHHDISVSLLLFESCINDIPADFDQVYITKDAQKIKEILANHDLIVDVDTPSIFDAIEDSGKPLIVECHSFSPESREYVKGDLPSNLKTIIVPSLSFKNVISKEIKQNNVPIEVVYNIVKKKKAKEGEFLNIDFETFRPILWIGRLEEGKDWKKALRILKILITRYKMRNLELFIVGYAPPVYEKPILEIIMDEGVLSHVRYLSAVDFEVMQEVYSRVKKQRGVYLSTSKFETFGLTVAEAMSYGLPCILNRLEVFKEVAGGDCLFFKNEETAAKHIYNIVKDRSLWEDFSDKAIKRSQEFNSKKIMQKLVKLYKRALT
jgi:glycosyltransferase involved in cell wall biosynthesis